MGRQRKLAQALEQLFSTPPQGINSPVQEGQAVEAKEDKDAFVLTEEAGSATESGNKQEVGKGGFTESIGESLTPPMSPPSPPEPEDKGALPSELLESQRLPAATPRSYPHPGSEEQHVIFALGDGYYGLPVEAVEAIIKMQPITRIPKTPTYIRGVTNLRGTVLPVIDLRQRLGLSAAEESEQTRIVVTHSQGGSAGLIVDSVDSVSRIDAEQIEPPPLRALSTSAAYLRGVARLGERLVLLLDLDRVWQGISTRGQGRNLYGTKPAQATLSAGNSTR